MAATSLDRSQKLCRITHGNGALDLHRITHSRLGESNVSFTCACCASKSHL